jgi:hypothetical protein
MNWTCLTAGPLLPAEPEMNRSRRICGLARGQRAFRKSPAGLRLFRPNSAEAVQKLKFQDNFV